MTIPSRSSFILLIIISFAFFYQVKSHEHQCVHDKKKFPIQFMKVPYNRDENGRILADTYENIRIYFDFTGKNQQLLVFLIYP